MPWAQAVQKEHMQQRHLGGLGRDRKGAKKPAVRPSMEARRRQLDLSALKARPSCSSSMR